MSAYCPKQSGSLFYQPRKDRGSLEGLTLHRSLMGSKERCKCRQAACSVPQKVSQQLGGDVGTRMWYCDDPLLLLYCFPDVVLVKGSCLSSCVLDLPQRGGKEHRWWGISRLPLRQPLSTDDGECQDSCRSDRGGPAVWQGGVVRTATPSHNRLGSRDSSKDSSGISCRVRNSCSDLTISWAGASAHDSHQGEASAGKRYGSQSWLCI